MAALRKRINQADMSAGQRDRYVKAVLQMKKTGVYDWYVQTHIDSMWMQTNGTMNMWAHHRPAFLPWHRQFVLDFENDLRAADTALTGNPSDLTVPYWDWINYRSKKEYLWWGRIWGDDFMGPNGSGSNNEVMTGPFKGGGTDWVLSYNAGPGFTSFSPVGPAYLTRSFGVNPRHVDSLPAQDHWDAARALTGYDTAPWDANVGAHPAPTPNPVRFAGINSFRNVFEGWVPYFDTATASPLRTNLHNRVHSWIGGAMGPMSSPNDPVFFLHHCNVDRLWAQWWSDDPSRPYLPKDGEPNPTDPVGDPDPLINLQGHHLHDPMPPWDGRNDPRKGTMPKITPADVLNHLALGYGYYPDDRVALSASGTP